MNKRHVPRILAVTIALLTFAVYVPSLGNDFVQWDDQEYVTENQHIRSLNTDFFLWAIRSYEPNYWHPLTWVSHAVDYAIWGLNPVGHHLTNAVLHAVNTFLVVRLIMVLFEVLNAQRLRSGILLPVQEQSILLTAGITGLLFGLHPLHVESVAWVSERKDLLCAMFFLLGTMAYLRRDRGAGKAAIFFRERYYLLSLLFFLLALASKPMAVTLPVVFLVLDWHPLGRISTIRDAVYVSLEKTPFVVLSLLVASGTFLAQSLGGAVAPLAVTSLAERFLFSCWALIEYIKNMVLPFLLLPYHQFPKDLSLLTPRYLISVALVGGLTAGGLLSAKKQRTITAAWLYYVITMLPVIGLIRVGMVAFADRFTYLPSLGPFLLAGLAGASVYSWSGSLPQRGATLRRYLVVLAVVILFAMAAATIRQISVWKDSVSLWSRVIEKGPERVFLAFYNRGAAFMEKGWVDRALQDYTEAISIDPRNADGYNNRGLAYREAGQLDRAIADFDRSIALKPDRNPSYANRGQTFSQLGAYDRALPDLTMALTLEPSSADLYLERGTAHRELGLPEKALEDYSRAIVLDPRSTTLYIHRAIVYKAKGEMERALEDYTTVIALDPFSAEAFNNRGVIYNHLSQLERALADYDRAISLQPSFHLAYLNRAVVLRKSGLNEKAIEDYTTAISLRPDVTAAYLYRGDLYRITGRIAGALQDFQKACELGSREGCNVRRRLAGM